MSAEEALAPTRRHQHILPDGRVAYEWSQSLSDVTVFVPCPEGVRGRDLDVCIERKRCRLGLKGNPPYLDVSFARCRLREKQQRDEKREERARERERAKRPWKKTFPSFAFDDARSKSSKTAKSLTSLLLSLFTSAPPKSQHATFSVVKASESFWTLGEMADWFDE